MLKLSGIEKSFGKKHVLKGVDLVVGDGRICGLLGLNGEGKSTLMKIVCGLVIPDGGCVEIDGDLVKPGKAPKGVGAMIEAPAFYGGLSGYDNLELMRVLCDGVPKERVGEVLRVAGIASSATVKVKDYSQGMKQRLYFAFALLKRPRVLILDEPFVNVDPVSVKLFEDVIKALAADGCTVLISGHIIAELKNVCDSAAILDGGTIKRNFDDLSSVDLEKEFLSAVSSSGDVR